MYDSLKNDPGMKEVICKEGDPLGGAFLSLPIRLAFSFLKFLDLQISVLGKPLGHIINIVDEK
jgi:hypothetical protein